MTVFRAALPGKAAAQGRLALPRPPNHHDHGGSNMAENTDTALSVSGQMSWREKKALHDAAVAEYDRHE